MRGLCICILVWFTFMAIGFEANSQDKIISGRVMNSTTGNPVEFPAVAIKGSNIAVNGDSTGFFKIKDAPEGKSTLMISALGYSKTQIHAEPSSKILKIYLDETENKTDEVVVTGTMKEVNKLNSAIPVEVYSPVFFKKNPTPSVFEALAMVNGVQPQLNCNVCGTGDIHINGMEGPYTMVLIDGMPIVSSLATVYGLMGIPNSMVRRVEIIKGPAATLYGSEAVAGIINIVTKDPLTAPKLTVDVMGTSYQELNADASTAIKMKKASVMLGMNVFNFNRRWDKNGDGFTDIPLQNRYSFFNKWQFERKNNRIATLAARYVYEDRFGGQMNWQPQNRGGDSIYGENIFTNRVELIGNYQLPVNKEKIFLQYSLSTHQQNSYYGNVRYDGQQYIGFTQLIWDKKLGQRHDLLVGLPFRYIYYDDNSVGTQKNDSVGTNSPQITYLPGVFVQDEFKITEKLSVLGGFRIDHNNNHGLIYSPRAAVKFSPTKSQTIRLSGGNGFRVVNLFTEDHAALTGARQVVIKEKLNPEESWNANINYLRFINHKYGYLSLDASAFYTYFTNKIVGDFLANPSQIIYDNIKGYAISRGFSLNMEASFTSGFKAMAGATYMDVYQVENDVQIPQLFAPRFSGTYQLSYEIAPWKLVVDYSGRVYGPMHLPVLENDFRPSMSPWFDLANIQFTKKLPSNLEIYAGIKNLWNFIPQNPLLRPFDPFDKRVVFDASGNPQPTADNPNAYTFDVAYNYAPVQTIRGFAGIRWNLH